MESKLYKEEKYIRLKIEIKDGNARIVFCKGDSKTPSKWQKMESSKDAQNATFNVSKKLLDKFLIDL